MGISVQTLKGEPPRVVQKVGAGNAVHVENHGGQVLIANGNVYGAFNNLDVGRSAQKIATPFKREAERLTIKESEDDLTSYTSAEAESFRKIRSGSDDIETTSEVLLTVKSPILEGRGLWRFRYGSTSITARMEDEQFRREVESGEQIFRHGDIFRVRLHSRQERRGRKVKTTHIIQEVIGRVA